MVASGGNQGKDFERLRSAEVVAKLPHIFGRNEDIPKDLIGAKIIRFGTFADESLVEGGGLVIEYQTTIQQETQRLVLAFDETAMWLVGSFPAA